jgi:hypothetical protein
LEDELGLEGQVLGLVGHEQLEGYQGGDAGWGEDLDALGGGLHFIAVIYNLFIRLFLFIYYFYI